MTEQPPRQRTTPDAGPTPRPGEPGNGQPSPAGAPPPRREAPSTPPRQDAPPPRREKPPPRHEPPPGWDDYRPGTGAAPPPRPGLPDLGSIIALLDALRTTVPPELRDQFNALVREVLLTLRALIDWYLERVDSAPREPRVEDIPID